MDAIASQRNLTGGPQGLSTQRVVLPPRAPQSAAPVRALGFEPLPAYLRASLGLAARR